MSADSASPWRLAPSLSSGARWAFHVLTQDRQAAANNRTLSPWFVLLSSSSFALLISALYRYGDRFGLERLRRWVFVKEGPLEDFTFLAELAAATCMAISARHVWLHRAGAHLTLVAIGYAGVAVFLFVVGMEEIGWGQQLLQFGTPQGWAAINYQQETTLHNLLDREGVNALGRSLAYSFVIFATASTVLGLTSDNAFIVAIAPHPSLLPLTCAIGLSTFILHAEVLEAFLALYFLYYSYRVLRLSAGHQRHGQGVA